MSRQFDSILVVSFLRCTFLYSRWFVCLSLPLSLFFFSFRSRSKSKRKQITRITNKTGHRFSSPIVQFWPLCLSFSSFIVLYHTVSRKPTKATFNKNWYTNINENRITWVRCLFYWCALLLCAVSIVSFTRVSLCKLCQVISIESCTIISTFSVCYNSPSFFLPLCAMSSHSYTQTHTSAYMHHLLVRIHSFD